MKKGINKEVMASLIDSLLGAFEKEKLERVSEIKDAIKALNLDWKDSEDINLFHIERLLEHVDVMVAETYPDVSQKELHKIQFIYKHYGFVSNNVRSLVDLGAGCCADKTRWIIKAYINHLVTGKEIFLPARTDKEHNYYHPDFGTFGEWCSFIEGLMNLYYRGIGASNLEIALNLIKKKSETKEELIEESRLANDYVSTYVEKVNNFVADGLLTNEQSQKALENYTKSVIIFGFIQEIKTGNLTDEMLLSKIKERC